MKGQIFLLFLLVLTTVCFASKNGPKRFDHHRDLKLDPSVKPLIIPLTQKIMSGHEIAQLHKEHQKLIQGDGEDGGGQQYPNFFQKFLDGGGDDRGGHKNSRLLQYIYKKDYLLANVTIGYPSNLDQDCVKFQKFQLSLETGHRNTFVFSNEFKLLNKTVQKVYNPVDSAVSELVDKNFRAQTGNLIINGSTYRDILNIQNYVYKSLFGVADTVHTIEKRGRVGFPIDGVFGISITNNTNTDTLIGNLCEESWRKNKYCGYTLWLGAHKKPSNELNDGSSSGQLTINGFDSNHCGVYAFDMHIRYYAQSNQVAVLIVSNFQFGSYKYSNSLYTSIDSGFSEIILPTDVYNNVIGLIDPEYNTETNLLTVDCNQVSRLPNLTFTLYDDYNGKNSIGNVTAKNYILDLNLPNNQCAVAIGPPQSAYVSDYVFGNPFIRSYCIKNIYSIGDDHIYFYVPKN